MSLLNKLLLFVGYLKGILVVSWLSKLSILKYLKIYKVGTLYKPYRYLIKTMQWFTKGTYYLNSALI